jgi:hypothetical protein
MHRNLLFIVTITSIACLLTSCSEGPDRFMSDLVIGDALKDAIADPSVTFRGHTGGGISGGSRSGWKITYYTKAIAPEPLDPKLAAKAIADELSKTIVDAGGNISGTGSSGSTSSKGSIPFTSSLAAPPGGIFSGGGSPSSSSSVLGYQNARFCYQLDSSCGYVSVWIVPDSDPTNGCHIMIDMYAN